MGKVYTEIGFSKTSPTRCAEARSRCCSLNPFAVNKELIIEHPRPQESKRTEQYPYVTNLDVKFNHFELIEIPAIVRACKDKWFNQTLTRVNDNVVRIGIVQGEYHWHKHDNDDEFFFVLEGQLLIDLENRTIELNPDQGVTISKGVIHRPRAPQKTVMLMVETSTVQPVGT